MQDLQSFVPITDHRTATGVEQPCLITIDDSQI